MRSIGIDPGDDTVKVVELDGSYRKTKLVRVHVAPAPQVGNEIGVRAEAIAASVEAAKAEGMRGDATLGHPCREAVLRTIELPFKGHDAIRKVIKAEIEGEIHSHVVDDMIVDFHEIGTAPEGGTRVLVASVPKEGLRTQLNALNDSGVEVDTVDLDTMALWRAAHWLGAFAEEEAADGAPAEGTADGLPPITAVVDLGARSVKVLLVESEQLVDMRALRLGDASIADEIARKNGLGAAQAREAVRACLATGTDQSIEVEEALPVAAAGPSAEAAEPPIVPRRQVVVSLDEVEAARVAFLQRLARELTRYLAASGKSARIRSLWITGGASLTTGTPEMLSAVFGVEPKALDVLGKLSHELEPEVAADLGPRLAVAVGLALQRFGGPDGFQLRQEDLVVTKGFERIKFPLAITCLVGWLALFVYANKRSVELRHLELEIGSTVKQKGDPKAPTMFYGMVFSVFGSKWFDDKAHFSFERDKGRLYTVKDLLAEVDAAPVAKRLQIIHDRLKQVADSKQKDSGIYEEVSLESGLSVLVRWSELLKAVHGQLGRYLVPKIDLNMKPGSRRLEFTIVFRGDDFRDKMATLARAIEAEYDNPDSPFEKRRQTKELEEPFKDAEESGVKGAYYRVTLAIKDNFDPFGASHAGGAK